MSDTNNTSTQSPVQVNPEAGPTQPAGFNEDLIKKYPRANKKISLSFTTYSLAAEELSAESGLSTFISPHGIEFQAPKDYPMGTLLKIHVSLPDYWTRKQKFVEYRRIDSPERFKILAKVVKTEDVGKRGKKKLVTVQTVNMDEIDEQVLKSFLQEG
jgi:hypothetical protein